MIKKFLGDYEIKYTKKIEKGPMAGLIKVILRGAQPGTPGPRLLLTEDQYKTHVKHVLVNKSENTTAAS